MNQSDDINLVAGDIFKYIKAITLSEKVMMLQQGFQRTP